MCIRDSNFFVDEAGQITLFDFDDCAHNWFINDVAIVLFYICLFYTSDAADERSSVDLGGRRIIKKKKTEWNGDQLSHTEIK